jgi:hypothetical protein
LFGRSVVGGVSGRCGTILRGLAGTSRRWRKGFDWGAEISGPALGAEARAAIEVALAWGYVEAGAAEGALGEADRVIAMLWRLAR